MRSIELVLDDAADRAVRAVWDALTAADLPSLGRSGTNTPHVTLAAGESLPVPTGFDVPVPRSVRLGGLLLFAAGPGRHVLARAVVVDEPLAAFHRSVHRVAPDAIATSVPGRWSPHLTFARRIRDDDLPRALEALTEVPVPEVLGVAGVRHWAGDTRVTTPLA